MHQRAERLPTLPLVAEQRSPLRVLVVYSFVRLLLFAVPFAAIWALSGNPVLSAVVAAVIGLALSVVLLDFQRNALAGALGARAARRKPSSDEAAEDDAVDGQTDSSPASPRP